MPAAALRTLESPSATAPGPRRLDQEPPAPSHGTAAGQDACSPIGGKLPFWFAGQKTHPVPQQGSKSVKAISSKTVDRTVATPIWLGVCLLAFIAGTLWTRPADSMLPAALAQSGPMAGARGIYAFTGQLDSAGRQGLFMLDIEQGTVWCYAIEQAGGNRKLRLIAARSWLYDRYLRDFNNAEPSYRMVQDLVAKQRLAPNDADADSDGN